MTKDKNDDKSKSIERTVKYEIIKPSLDLTVDYAELTLDSFLDNEAIREFPIVKTFIGVVKGGLKVREIFFVKKLLTFLKEFHSNKVDEETTKEFQNRFNTDTKYRESIIEQVVILNDRFLEIQKSKILGNLFAAHINKKLDWELYQHLSICLEGLHIRGLQILQEISEFDPPFRFSISDRSRAEGQGMLSSAGLAIIFNESVIINSKGKYLYYYGIKGDINYVFENTGQW